MDQELVSSTAVIQRLLKTNRSPTDEERAEILESVLPTTKAKLKVVEEQISDVIAHIDALKLQIEQAEIKLHRLREQETAILGIFADHRRVFAPFRNLPEDVLREICVACVQGDLPALVYGRTPMPYILSQICSGMRHIVLTTPSIWAYIKVDIARGYDHHFGVGKDVYYAILARRTMEWFERAGGLALTVVVKYGSTVHAILYGSGSKKPDPATILFDTLLSYSTRWKEFQFESSRQALPESMFRIAAWTAADVPLLQSVSLRFDGEWMPTEVFHDSKFLSVPTLRRVTLQNAFRMFPVDWAVLTSFTLCGETGSKNEIWRILEHTKRLEFCRIVVPHSDEHHDDDIILPFLKTLIVSETTMDENLSGAHSILEAITAPILEIFENHVQFFDLSLLDFLQRSPYIRKISLYHFHKDIFLTEMMEFLCHCPSLIVLSIEVYHRYQNTFDGNQFLRAFVEQENHGTICPRLQDFSISGNIDFSYETLRVFLEGKQGVSTPNVSPWKRVVIKSGVRTSAEICQQISDLVSQKNTVGLYVHVKFPFH